MANVKTHVSDELTLIADASNIGSNAVTTAKISTNAVTTAKLDTGAVTVNELAASTITAAKVNYTLVASAITSVTTTITHSLGASPSIVIFEATAANSTRNARTISKNSTTCLFDANADFWTGNIVFIK